MADRKLDDDEDEDDDLDSTPAKDADDAEASGDEEPEPDFEDEESQEGGGGRGRLFVIGGIVAAFVIGVAAGGYFFFLNGDEAPSVADAPAAVSSADGTSMVIARRRMLTAEELAQGQSAPANDAETKGDGRAAPPSGTALTPPPQAAPPQAPTRQPTPPIAAPAPSEAPPVTAPKGQATAQGGKAKGGTTKSGTTSQAGAQAEQPGQGLVTPAAAAAAYRDIPVQPPGKPLTSPIISLVETTEVGQLPKAQGSQAPWKAYARPFDGPADKPKIAVIITGMGLARAPTLAGINQLVGGFTLAFDPYAKGIDDWVGIGRSNGHEALMQLPMETTDFPVLDPGPFALLTDLDAPQNIARMHQVLASAKGYVGLLQVMGSKFSSSETAMRPVLEEAKKRGLLFVGMEASNEDRGAAIAEEIALPSVYVDVKLDDVASGAAIDERLTELERIARERGHAVALAEAYPVTIAKLAEWVGSLAFKELALAPVSAVVTVPASPQRAAPGAKK